jgi:hypothetical protein
VRGLLQSVVVEHNTAQTFDNALQATASNFSS